MEPRQRTEAEIMQSANKGTGAVAAAIKDRTMKIEYDQPAAKAEQDASQNPQPDPDSLA